MPKASLPQAYSIFRTLLKDLRSTKGLTQAQLAERLGLPQSYVSKFETGERRLDFVETVLVCEALETTIQELANAFARRVAKARRGKAT